MTNLLLWNCFRGPRKLSWNNGFNSTRKFSVFFNVWGLEIISRKSLLFLPRWNMIRVNVFCCLARDCNYCDVMKTYAMLISKADCIARDKILFSKFLDVSEVFETVMYAITSHKKQRVKYQREMLSHIAKTAILVKRSNYKVKLPAKKKNAQTVDTDNQTFNCDNADGHWFTNRQSKRYRRVKFENNVKRLRALFTHRRVFNIYLYKVPLHLFWILQITGRLKSFPWDALVYGSIMTFYLNLAK